MVEAVKVVQVIEVKVRQGDSLKVQWWTVSGDLIAEQEQGNE